MQLLRSKDTHIATTTASLPACRASACAVYERQPDLTVITTLERDDGGAFVLAQTPKQPAGHSL